MLAQVNEYFGTFAAQGLVLVAQLAAFRVAASGLGPEGFSEFAMARRTLSVLQPLTWMGMGVALPRFLADTRLSHAERKSAYATTIWVVGLTSIFCAALLTFGREPAARLFFGDASYAAFMPVLGLMALGMGVHATAYSYFRGVLNMRAANALYVVNLAIVPLVGLLLSDDALEALRLIGFAWLLVSCVWFVRTPWTDSLALSARGARRVAMYGVPRMPGQLAAMVLLTAPATIASHRYGVLVGGFVAFGTSILGMAAAGFAPISLVLLPRASQMIADGAALELRVHVRRLLQATLWISVSAALVLAIFGQPIVTAFLGDEFASAVTIVRIAALGIVPYSLYIVCRGLIDAYHERALTTLYVIVALVVFAALVGVTEPTATSPVPITFALSAGLTVLGALCLFETKRVLSRQTATTDPLNEEGGGGANAGRD